MSYLKKLGIIFVILGSLLAVYDLATSLGGSNKASASAPADLNGHWHQTKSGIPRAVMSADINNGKIEIAVKMGDTGGLYWVGTFDAGRNPSNTFMTDSIGDRDVMDTEMFASQDSSKMFTYKDGDLSYDYSILGIPTTVHLSK